jgi:hypothetical protein
MRTSASHAPVEGWIGALPARSVIRLLQSLGSNQSGNLIWIPDPVQNYGKSSSIELPPGNSTLGQPQSRKLFPKNEGKAGLSEGLREKILSSFLLVMRALRVCG